jgi:hypothetical protein
VPGLLTVEANGLGPPSLVRVRYGEQGYYWQVVDRYNRVLEQSDRRFSTCYWALGAAKPYVRGLPYVMKLGPSFPKPKQRETGSRTTDSGEEKN